MSSKSNLVLWLASSALIAVANPAAAQTTGQTPGQTTGASAAAPADNADMTVAEVVVTATRRSERLQDVPLAVSVLTADKLAATGFKNLNDIQYQAPGITITPASSTTDNGIRLRGVGTAASFASSSEQNVGLVVDSVVVPFGNPVGSLGDVDRIETLKGPQGTQFGKNASSGVVSITTSKPKIGEFSGSGFASYASLNEYDVNGSVNVPLGDTLAAQVFAFERGYDGLIYNKVQKRDWGGNKTSGARGKLLWKPTDRFSAYLIADYTHADTKGTNPWTINSLPASGGFAASSAALSGLTPGPDNDVSIENYGGDTITANYGVSLELNYELGDYTLTSVSAWREYRVSASDYSIDASDLNTFTAQTAANKDRFYSQELRLTSPSGERLQYVAGVFASRLEVGLGSASSAQYRPLITVSPDLIVSISNGIGSVETTSESQAAFVDGSFRLNDKLRLLGGLRVNHDKVSAFSYSKLDPAYPGGASAAGFVVPYTANVLATSQVGGTDWSGRTGLEYKPVADAMIYATVARGYLGPTTTFSILSNTKSSVKPQTVNDVTVGAKTQFFDRRLTLNGNVFYDSYKNLQTSVFKNAEFITGNAGGLKTRGLEVEAALRPNRNLGFNLGYSYVKATYTDYLTDCPISILLGAAGAADPRCTKGPAGSQYQAKGDDLVGAPRNTFNAGADFRRPMGGFVIDGAVSYYYRDKTYSTAGDEATRLPSYQIVNVNLGLGKADGDWRASIFARNLFDEHFNLSMLGAAFAPTGTLLNVVNRDGRRTVGVALSARF